MISLFVPEYDDTNSAFQSNVWDMHVIREFFPRLQAHCMCHTVVWKGFGSFTTGSHCRVLYSSSTSTMDGNVLPKFLFK